MERDCEQTLDPSTDKEPDFTGKHLDPEHNTLTWQRKREPAKEQGPGDEQGAEQYPPKRGYEPTQEST